MRWLHFGCGPNKLPAPWENHDRDIDIARPLPFESSTARYIFAEHVIEHVPFVEGMAFLSECRRVLEPGGVLRFSFPDVTRFTSEWQVTEYCRYLIACRRAAGAGRADVFRYIISGSGHRACWTGDMAWAVLIALGFTASARPDYGQSFYTQDLRDIDGHHKTSPVALLETSIFEATK